MRLAVLEDLIRLRVVERQRRSRSMRLARRLLDVLDGVVEQRERAEAEEVHLQEADALDLLHRPLRRDFAVVLLALVERDELGERPRRDDDAGGVHRGVAGHALEPPGDGEQVAGRASSRFSSSASAGLSSSAMSSVMSSWFGISLATLIDLGDRHLHHAADVAHDRAAPSSCRT